MSLPLWFVVVGSFVGWSVCWTSFGFPFGLCCVLSPAFHLDFAPQLPSITALRRGFPPAPSSGPPFGVSA